MKVDGYIASFKRHRTVIFMFLITVLSICLVLWLFRKAMDRIQDDILEVGLFLPGLITLLIRNKYLIEYLKTYVMKTSILISYILALSTLLSAQNVGIGISTPGFPLNFASSLGDKISLYGTSGGHYGFGVASSLLFIHSDQSTTDIAFGYGSYNEFTERMRIRGDGRVGIGTSAPTSTLHVKRGLSNSTTAFEGTTFISLFNLQDTEHTYIRGGKAGSHVILNDNVLHGNIGVGTSTPSAKLDVVRGSSTDGTARFQGTMHHSHFNYSGTEHTYIKGGKDGSHVVINDHALLGNVGIGTAAPAAKLDVIRGTAFEGTARFRGTTFHSHFNFSATENTFIRGGKNGSHVLLNDQPGLGNVGIGTATPVAKLDVNGHAQISGFLTLGRTIAFSASIVLPPLQITTGTCECPDDMYALSGGFSISASDVIVVHSHPQNPNTWSIGVANTNVVAERTLTVYAVCARLN